jgi:iron(III) transport system substrate-binding protein
LGQRLWTSFASEVGAARPAGYRCTTLATLLQLFGEDEAFDLLKAMHQNVNQYTKSGSAPLKAAARGETTIGARSDRQTQKGGLRSLA